MPVTYPHTFVDGVDMVGSGAEMMDNLNAAKSVVDGNEADIDAGFAAYRDLPFVAHGIALGGLTGGAYVLPNDSIAALPNVNYLSGDWLLYLDPADYVVSGRVAKIRLRGYFLTNATAPGISFTLALYPVSTWSSPSGQTPVPLTLGVPLTGSPGVSVTPGANARLAAASGEFAVPSAGFYAPGVVLSGSNAADSLVVVQARLQLRHV